MISIAIPTYLQPIYGGKMLTVLLNSIRHQKVTCDYEVVVSDNDITGQIKYICENFKDYLPIQWHFNPVTGASENINNAIDLCCGDKIKLMMMDDAFVTIDAVDVFNSALDEKNWVIGNSVHINEAGDVYGRRYTQYNHRQMEKNITGMPSVIGFRKCDLRFNPALKTFCDTYFYYQLYELYGQPKVIDKFTIACRFWRGSLSQNQVAKKEEEIKFLREQKMIKC